VESMERLQNRLRHCRDHDAIGPSAEIVSQLVPKLTPWKTEPC
jgi:hypothetical protein